MERKKLLVGALVLVGAVGFLVSYQVWTVYLPSLLGPGTDTGGFQLACGPDEDPVYEPVPISSIPSEERALIRKAIEGDTPIINRSQAESLSEYRAVTVGNTTYNCVTGTL